jgi:hypothetical protein
MTMDISTRIRNGPKSSAPTHGPQPAVAFMIQVPGTHCHSDTVLRFTGGMNTHWHVKKQR